MPTTNLSLLRERIIVFDIDEEGKRGEEIAKSLSNRISLTLVSGDGSHSEKFIIRAQAMHLCTRMAAEILQEFHSRGFLANRLHDHQWKKIWTNSCGTYDISYNPNRWGAIYHEGKLFFRSSEDENKLLDIIESQHVKKGATYDQAIFLIQDAFENAGKNVIIDYDSNIGLVCNLSPKSGRCSIILRGPGRTTTFNFATTPNDKDGKINMPQCLIGCAAFLEGIQLSYTIGTTSAKAERGHIPRSGGDMVAAQVGRRHLLSLTREIGTMERLMAVRYRPERPEFQNLIVEVQQQAMKSLRR